MAKVITVAQKFMSDHPRAGQATFFVEQILNSIDLDWDSHRYLELLHRLNPDKEDLVYDFWINLGGTGTPWDSEKHHTIRAGHRFKEGEMVSLRVWSDKPRRSPQIIFAPDVEVKKVYDFEINNGSAFRNGIPFALNLDDRYDLAKNDGLELHDFYHWFKWGKQNFYGQIICWGEVNYGK